MIILLTLSVTTVVVLAGVVAYQRHTIRGHQADADQLRAELATARSTVAIKTAECEELQAAHAATCEQHEAAARHQAAEAAHGVVREVMDAVVSRSKTQELRIEELQREHADPAVLAGLLHVQRLVSEQRQAAQALLVVCGSGGWTGQVRTAASLYDIVRSAQGRVADAANHVRLSGRADVLVTPTVVEPLAVALAELLKNACACSPSDIAVVVTLERAQRGWVVRIDDGGLGMHRDQRDIARARLDASQEIDILSLGAVPQIGIAAVATVAAHHGFRVDVGAPSDRGGVRATVFIPLQLLRAKPASTPIAATDPAPASPVAAPASPNTTAQDPAPVPPRRRKTPAHTVATNYASYTGSLTDLDPAPSSPSRPYPVPPSAESAGVARQFQSAIHHRIQGAS